MVGRWFLKFRDTPFLFLIFFLAVYTSVSYAEPFSEEERSVRKSFSLLVFMHACVLSHGEPVETDLKARKLGFRHANQGTASIYLKNRPGQAWSLDSPEGFFVVTLLDNSLCSVFIHQGDAERLRAGFEAWLPDGNSGFRVVDHRQRQAGYLKTTAYDIFNNESLVERWVITTSSDQRSEVRAIMSYISAMHLNHGDKPQ